MTKKSCMHYKNHLHEDIGKSEDRGELSGRDTEEEGDPGYEPSIRLFFWGHFPFLQNVWEAEHWCFNRSLDYEKRGSEFPARRLALLGYCIREEKTTRTRPETERIYFRAWYPHEGNLRVLCAQAVVQRFFLHKGNTNLDPILLVQSILWTNAWHIIKNNWAGSGRFWVRWCVHILSPLFSPEPNYTPGSINAGHRTEYSGNK